MKTNNTQNLLDIPFLQEDAIKKAAQKLKAIRETLDVSIYAVAKGSGFSYSTINRMEEEETTPTLEVLLDIKLFDEWVYDTDVYNYCFRNFRYKYKPKSISNTLDNAVSKGWLIREPDSSPKRYRKKRSKV